MIDNPISQLTTLANTIINTGQAPLHYGLAARVAGATACPFVCAPCLVVGQLFTCGKANHCTERTDDAISTYTSSFDKPIQVEPIDIVLAATTIKEELLTLVRLLSHEFYQRPFKTHHYLLCTVVVAPLLGDSDGIIPTPIGVMKKLVDLRERIRLIECVISRQNVLTNDVDVEDFKSVVEDLSV